MAWVYGRQPVFSARPGFFFGISGRWQIIQLRDRAEKAVRDGGGRTGAAGGREAPLTFGLESHRHHHRAPTILRVPYGFSACRAPLEKRMFKPPGDDVSRDVTKWFHGCCRLWAPVSSVDSPAFPTQVWCRGARSDTRDIPVGPVGVELSTKPNRDKPA